MSLITLEQYNKQDQQQVISLILQIQRNEFGVDITEADQPDLMTVDTYYQQGNGQFWVAKVNSVVVGTIALLDIGQQQCAIRKMFVKSEYRGASYKIAQKLLEVLLEWCQQKQVTAIFLGTIDKYKAAHRFYEKNGFDTCLKSELPDSFPLISVDNVFYAKVV
jgi:N-acetylglutamate synthase-like GNAT family acetyltransferase